MDERLKRSAVVEKPQRAKRGRTPAKVSPEPETPAPAEAIVATGISLPPEVKSLIPSAALIGVGLLLESELLVGIAIGTGVVLTSRWLPEAVGKNVQPIVTSTVKACYLAAAKTSEMVGEAVERVGELVMRRGSLREEATAASEEERGPQGNQPQA